MYLKTYKHTHTHSVAFALLRCHVIIHNLMSSTLILFPKKIFAAISLFIVAAFSSLPFDFIFIFFIILE